MSKSDRLRRNIKALLSWRELTQGALGPVLGLSQAGVSERMRGITDFRFSELELIAEFLGVELTALIEEASVIQLPTLTPSATHAQEEV